MHVVNELRKLSSPELGILTVGAWMRNVTGANRDTDLQ